MDEETIARIVEEYSLLKLSIKELNEVKKDKNGAILDYIATYYHYAQKAVEFLESQLTPALKTRLDIQMLERTLNDFANTNIHL